jgi:hypothetical protein
MPYRSTISLDDRRTMSWVQSHGTQARIEDVQPKNSFSFDVRIMSSANGNEQYTPVRALLDTGSPVNWISLEVLQRANSEALLGTIKTTLPYIGFGGHVEPCGETQITWCAASNPQKSWKLPFLVLEHAPFDMVLGRRFIIEGNVLLLNEAVLALRHSDLSKGMTFNPTQINYDK